MCHRKNQPSLPLSAVLGIQRKRKPCSCLRSSQSCEKMKGEGDNNSDVSASPQQCQQVTCSTHRGTEQEQRAGRTCLQAVPSQRITLSFIPLQMALRSGDLPGTVSGTLNASCLVYLLSWQTLYTWHYFHLPIKLRPKAKTLLGVSHVANPWRLELRIPGHKPCARPCVCNPQNTWERILLAEAQIPGPHPKRVRTKTAFYKNNVK